MPINDDEPVVVFVNSETRKRLSEIPDDAVVITEVLTNDNIIVVPLEEFVQWLMDEEMCRSELS